MKYLFGFLILCVISYYILRRKKVIVINRKKRTDKHILTDYYGGLNEYRNQHSGLQDFYDDEDGTHVIDKLN